MIIEIPKGYKFTSNKNDDVNNNYAYEQDGKLFIVGGVPFERLMYDLTYQLKDKDSEHCYYCKCTLSAVNRTLDHKYPRHFGGISIPNNLVPCCVHCNEEKSNLTAHQYKEYLSIKKEASQKNFRRYSLELNQKYQSIIGYFLPEEWVSTNSRNKIVTEINLGDDYYKGKRYKKIKTFYKRNGCVPRPIIISSNNVLLDGFLILMYAKNFKVSHLPTIVLENVIVK